MGSICRIPLAVENISQSIAAIAARGDGEEEVAAFPKAVPERCAGSFI